MGLLLPHTKLFQNVIISNLYAKKKGYPKQKQILLDKNFLIKFMILKNIKSFNKSRQAMKSTLVNNFWQLEATEQESLRNKLSTFL